MSQRFLLIIVSVGIVAAFAECNAQDFWQLTDGVSGTGLYSMAIDNHGHYYAGMADNLYRSTDNGNTWIKLSYTVNGGNRFPYEIEFLAIDSSGNIYAVVDSLIEHPYPYGETVDLSLYGSTDEGKSWVSRTQQWWTAGVGCIMIDKNQNIYVGRGDGLYESTNNGMNWISLTSQPIMSSFISRSGEIYAGTVGGYSTGTIIKSTDGGNNWHLIDSGYTSGGVFCFTENSRGDIFAGTYNGAYRTTNEGNEWQKLDLN
ncbi:MAG TPA: hypothetical protein VFA55_02050, partial [Candidatus Kapabacteria bacterium]|nr:hypothetical protein [Candidatus Kapabacteria bacterium]